MFLSNVLDNVVIHQIVGEFCIMHTPLIRVLLVEDDEDDYFLVRDVIESIDRVRHEIVWCDTFDKGFDALTEQSFDVALIDYLIGSKTGIEFVTRAKADGLDVPMILLTGLQDGEIDIAASEAGASDYLTKDELAPAVVERAIRFARANAATRRSLAERSGLLQTTLDNSGSGLAALDANGKLIAYNQQFGELVCQLNSQIGPVALRLTSADIDESVLEVAIGEILRRSAVDANGPNELRTLDERILELSISKTNEGGSVVVIRDITEQRLFEQNLTRAKEAAEAANRSKTAFLATMSHELRTPLNAIIGFSELILCGTLGEVEPKIYRDYISDIHDSGNHLLEIISEILDFAKVEAGTSEIDKKHLYLKSELEFCLRLMMPHAKSSGLSLQSDFERFDGYVFADPTAFRRMVINVLSNAIKFTPEGGLVTLSANHHDDGSLSIVVTDTGIGIPGDALPLVVQPFYQVHGEFDRSYEGTGLGLSIVNSLAKLHDAEVKIDSVFGNGTTVALNLPRQIVKAGNAEGSSWQVAL